MFVVHISGRALENPSAQLHVPSCFLMCLKHCCMQHCFLFVLNISSFINHILVRRGLNISKIILNSGGIKCIHILEWVKHSIFSIPILLVVVVSVRCCCSFLSSILEYNILVKLVALSLLFSLSLSFLYPVKLVALSLSLVSCLCLFLELCL